MAQRFLIGSLMPCKRGYSRIWQACWWGSGVFSFEWRGASAPSAWRQGNLHTRKNWGLLGRTLQKGDEIFTLPSPPQQKRLLPKKHRPLYAKETSLPALLGTEAHYFSLQSVRRFFHSAYTITQRADRDGHLFRGNGPRVAFVKRAGV